MRFLKRLWYGADDKSPPTAESAECQLFTTYHEACGCKLTTKGDGEMMMGHFVACERHAGPASDAIYETLLGRALTGHFFGGGE